MRAGLTVGGHLVSSVDEVYLPNFYCRLILFHEQFYYKFEIMSLLLWFIWECQRVVEKPPTYVQMLRFDIQGLSLHWWIGVWLLILGKFFASIRMWSWLAITWGTGNSFECGWWRISYTRAYRAIKGEGNWRRSTQVEVKMRVINFVVDIYVTVMNSLFKFVLMYTRMDKICATNDGRLIWDLRHSWTLDRGSCIIMMNVKLHIPIVFFVKPDVRLYIFFTIAFCFRFYRRLSGMSDIYVIMSNESSLS